MNLSCPKCSSSISSETLRCSACKIEIQPLKIYDTANVNSSSKNAVFGFGAESRKDVSDFLFGSGEIKLVERIAGSQLHPLQDILKQLEIDINHCWIGTNIPTEKLIDKRLEKKLRNKLPRTDNQKTAGDIDLIVGDIIGNELSFSRLIAFQAKKRNMGSGEQLGRFSTGFGTRQAFFTALMGFDRTLLFHIFTREPRPVGEGYAPSWNPIVNSDFHRMMRASYESIKKQLCRELYGYAWLGWGQALGEKPEECGGISSDVVVEPPLRPMNYDADVCASREMVIKSLTELFSQELKKQGGIKTSPFVFKWPIQA